MVQSWTDEHLFETKRDVLVPRVLDLFVALARRKGQWDYRLSTLLTSKLSSLIRNPSAGLRALLPTIELCVMTRIEDSADNQKRRAELGKPDTFHTLFRCPFRVCRLVALHASSFKPKSRRF